MIYSISDLHLDYTKEKSMELFGGNWDNYEERIFENWSKIITENDCVLIPGDISWAMTIDESYKDLKRIDDMPGTKIMLKGNHDYWWSSLKKVNDMGFKSIKYLQNNSFIFEGVNIIGTRGWASKDSTEFNENDEKVFDRELMRLQMSYDSIDDKTKPTIAILHYPPFNRDRTLNEFGKLLKKLNISICLYGHIHGPGLQGIEEQEGIIEEIEFHCVSSDYLQFIPKLIVK